MTAILILIAVSYFHTRALGEPQELASTNRTPTPAPALLLYLQKLRNSKVGMLDQHMQSVLESHTISAASSARDVLYIKSEDIEESINDSSVPHGRVKRHKHSSGHHLSRPGSWGCPLATCQTHNLANWLYLLAMNKGKDDTAPKNTGDPHSYGKRRRRSLLSLLGNPTRLRMNGAEGEQ